MYDMGAANRNALQQFADASSSARQIIAAAAEQRWAEFDGAETAVRGRHGPGADRRHALRSSASSSTSTARSRGEFTPEGASPERTTKPTVTSNVKFMNFYPFNDIETISPRPMLFIAGDQAHSREFSEKAYRACGRAEGARLGRRARATSISTTAST